MYGVKNRKESRRMRREEDWVRYIFKFLTIPVLNLGTKADIFIHLRKVIDF